MNGKVPSSVRKQPPGGSRKGVPNKVTRELKEMILAALDKAGGVEYLAVCARNQKTAPAFLALLGRVLPMQVTGEGGGPVQIARIELVPLAGPGPKDEALPR